MNYNNLIFKGSKMAMVNLNNIAYKQQVGGECTKMRSLKSKIYLKAKNNYKFKLLDKFIDFHPSPYYMLSS